ncbi:MAG: O-antigen ligase family protein [Candidatus Acidiferrales bacterium]
MTLGFGTGLGHLIPLMLYLTAIIACLVSIFWKPHYGMYLLIPLLPLQTTRYKLFDFPMGNKLIDIILISVIIGLLLNGRSIIPKTSVNRPILALAVVFYAALWHGSFYLNRAMPLSIDDPRVSDFKNYMVMPLLFLVVVATIRELKQIYVVVSVSVLSTILVYVSYLLSMRGRDLSHFSYSTRDAGVLGYAGENGFAAYVAQMVVLLFALYAFQKNKSLRLILLGLNALGIYCLLFSYSRGAYLAFALGLGFMALFRERKILVGLLVVVLGWQIFLPTAASERIAMTYNKDTGLESSAQERVQLWEDAWQLFVGHPVFGIGLETYEYMDRVSAEGHGWLHDTHDYYLKVLAETGLVGLFIFLWLLFCILREGWRLFCEAEEPFLKSLGLGFTALMVCAIVLNLFGDRWTYIQVDGILWALLGCVVSGRAICSRMREKEAEEEEEPVLATVTASPVS